MRRMVTYPVRKWLAIFTLLCAVSPHRAEAGASRWEETDGARLRIVAERAQPGQETLRGILQIELEPGWKTYWREPGSAGIPPMVSVQNEAIAGVTIHYPAPEWTDDPYGSWAGYKHPVSLPLTFAVAGDETPEAFDADVFLGICRDVCVPVGVQFEVPVSESRSNTMQALLIDTAFSALPGENSDRLSVDSAEWTADGDLEVTLKHSISAEAEPSLFIAAGADRPFKKPERVSGSATGTVFRVEPAFDPAEAGDLDLIIAARNGIDAVEIAIEVPAPPAI